MSSHNSIRLLDEEVSRLLKSQVTISSLTDALREVVQNSVDAEAKTINITIDFKNLSFVVKDDGYGLTPNELNRIGSRYYTSKIKSLKELKTIKTFGFRGEALHSIASVSTLLIASKSPKFNATFQTCFDHSKRLYQSRVVDEDSKFFRAITGQSGSIISLSNIFSNVPVRLAQLEKLSETRMLEEIRLILFHVAITNPQVNITCHKKASFENELICMVKENASQSKEELITSLLSSIYGISLRGHYKFLESSFQDYQVSCIIGNLPVQSKLYQHVFYNQRVLNQIDLMKDINKQFSDSGFGDQTEVLMSSMSRSDISPKKGKSSTKIATSVGNPYSRYPLFIIMASGPQSLSDVLHNPSKNVEMSKHSNIIAPLALKIMKSFLKMNHYSVGRSKKVKPIIEDDVHESKDFSPMILLNTRIRTGKISNDEFRGMSTNDQELPPKHINHDTIDNIVKRKKPYSNRLTVPINHRCDHNDDYSISVDKPIDRDILLNCQIISQVDTKFILLRGKNHTLYIIDQHACDERIRVECLLEEFISKVQSPFQDVAVPLNKRSFEIETSHSERDLFRQYSYVCERWGIKYEVLKSDPVLVTHLPEILHSKVDEGRGFMKKCLLQYLFDLHGNVKIRSIPDDWFLCLQAVPTIILDLINSKACRSAIMFGKHLQKDEITHLVQSLSTCKLPLQCAHGRPSIVPLCDLSKFNR